MCLSALVAASPAVGNDGGLLRVAQDVLPGVDRAALRGASGAPSAVQEQYDAARAMQEALRQVGGVSRRCRALAGSLTRYANAEVHAAEAVDRQSPSAGAASRSAAARAERDASADRPRCVPAPAEPVPAVAQIATPSSGELSFGELSTSAPRRATSADLSVDGRPPQLVSLAAGRVETTLDVPPGPHDLSLRFWAAGHVIQRQRSTAVRFVGAAGRSRLAQWVSDAARSAALARLARSFEGDAAFVVYDPVSGRDATWNAEARFPAASTVKLGVLAAAATVLAGREGASPVAYDMTALAGWSSNLATNRLLELLGSGDTSAGARRAETELRRLGARQSTFPGGYIVGTSAPAVQDAPPVTTRTTTALDLARVLASLNAAASGDPAALTMTGLSSRTARFVLGLLLASEPSGDNLGLLRPFVPSAVPMAQKQGWLHDARHTASIIYTPRGPRIVVILTYAPGLTLRDAQAIGRQLARLALS